MIIEILPPPTCEFWYLSAGMGVITCTLLLVVILHSPRDIPCHNEHRENGGKLSLAEAVILE